MLGKEALLLLAKCLNINPDERELATEALLHSFLSFGGSISHQTVQLEKTRKEDQINYVKGLFWSFITQSNKLKLPKTLLLNQSNLNEKMRKTLIEWMNDVVMNCALSDHCFMLAVSILDRYMSLCRIEIKVLQLVGTASLKIAE